MTNLIFIIPIVTSFLITLTLLPSWIKKAKEIGLAWNDMNKLEKEKTAGSGGIVVFFGFTIGILIYVAIIVFNFGASSETLVKIFSLLSVIFLLASIGFIDDLFGWMRGGLSRKSRLILVCLSSIPLIAINAGKSAINLPFLGVFDLGILYPLILIPIGVTGATTTFNFLAGFNGLEAGQGAILLSALAIVSYYTGSLWLSVISLCMVASLVAFIIYNFFPARVFPGDVLTYSVGGLIAITAILGNFEKIAVFFFIPYILETILKIRGKLEIQSFSKPKKSSIDLRYSKIYSLNHLAIYLMKKANIRPGEQKVVLCIWIFQIIIILLGFFIFRGGIFST